MKLAFTIFTPQCVTKAAGLSENQAAKVSYNPFTNQVVSPLKYFCWWFRNPIHNHRLDGAKTL